MLLDLFPRDQQSALGTYSRLPVLPRDTAGFGERFGLEFDDYLNQSASISRAVNEYRIWSDAIDQLHRRTGRLIAFPADTATKAAAVEAFRTARAEHPDLPDPADFDARIAERVRTEHKAAGLAAQVSTFGGDVGGFLGALAGAVADPVNIASLWLGAPRAAGILATAAREAAIGAASQAAIETIAAPYRAELGIADVSSVENIAMAGAGGAVLGGAARAAVKLFDRLRLGGEVDIPLAVRDARNTVEAAQRLHDSNPLPAERLDLHSAALREAVEAVAEGRRVEGAALARAYDEVRARPIGPADDPLVALQKSDIERVLVERGPVRERDGEIEVQWKDERGFGIAKVIWQHGEESGKKPMLRVTRDDVIALPDVIRDFEPNPGSAPGRLEWRVPRPSEEGVARDVVYVTSPMPGSKTESRIATIYVQDPKAIGADRPISQRKTGVPGSPMGSYEPPSRDTAGGFVRPGPEPGTAGDGNIARSAAADNAVPPRALDEAQATIEAQAKPEATDALVANVARQVEADDIQVGVDLDGGTRSARELLAEAKAEKAAAAEIEGCALGGEGST